MRLTDRYGLSGFFFLLFVLFIFHPEISLSQDSHAIDAGAGCRGTVQPDPGLNPGATWTGECWVYLEDDSSAEQIIFCSDSQPDAWALKVVNGLPAMTVNIGGGDEFDVVGVTPLPLGAWAHIAALFTGTDIHLYLNGSFEGSTLAVVGPALAPGPIIISSDDPGLQFSGLIDQIQLADTVRYSGNFDPFSTDLLDLRVGDQEVPGWALGTGPGDLLEAWDFTSLVAIINGGAEIYMDYNFQYAVQQLYYGQISGLDRTLTLWMTDQGTPEDAQSLYHDPAMIPPFTAVIDTIGEEARLDTNLLFDWSLEFWRDRYYVDVIISKLNYPDEALQIAAAFAEIVDENILNRHLFPVDGHSTALWYLDEGSGAAFYDASGHSHDGTLTNPAWIGATPYQPVVYITSTIVLEGDVINAAIDEDDTALVAFSESLAEFHLNAGNIDDVLRLSSGHSWLSGSSELGAVTWNGGRDTVRIGFSVTGGAPTIADGDTITPDPLTVMNPDSLPAGGYRFVRFESSTGLGEQSAMALPDTPYLHAPYPSPFNAQAAIRIDLPSASEVTLSAYNLLGRKIDEIYTGRLSAGRHQFIWDAADFGSGIYFITFQSRADLQLRKAVLLK